MPLNRKIIFDAFRKMLGRGLTQQDVVTLDAALTVAEQARVVPDAPSIPERNQTPKRISLQGRALIKGFEGCATKLPDGRVQAYPDPGTGGAPWTIGWGATGPGIAPGVIWSQAQCDERFIDDMAKYERDVLQALGPAIARTSQPQFDAMVSFHYNTGAINRATLTAKHRAGDFVGAAAEFTRWNKAGGRVLAGLTRRRAAEAAMYRAGS